ncbi:MAG TPA: hypothetical protein VFS40_09235 [Gemmatimonadales bacterium]|nr:hypothetical protein [Gemmatimonadales bacterium]
MLHRAPPLRVRLLAALLALLFAGSSFGYANLDALLFHHEDRGASDVPASASHLELPGGCGAHAERCPLGHQAFAPRLPAVHASTVRLVHAVAGAPLGVSARRPHALPPVHLRPSRAPPASA